MQKDYEFLQAKLAEIEFEKNPNLPEKKPEKLVRKSI